METEFLQNSNNTKSNYADISLDNKSKKFVSFPIDFSFREDVHPNNNEQTINKFTIYLTCIAALGGFLFGYDTGVISGAMLLIKTDFHLNNVQQESVVSITTLGAVFGCVMGGGLFNPMYGRKPSILLSSFIFILGAALMAFANGFVMLLGGRFVVGLGIGLTSHAVPMYISETAPSNYRGLLVQVNTMFITGGQFVAGMTDGVLSTTPEGWRWMLGLSAVPATLMMLGFLQLPESPRWLLGVKRRDSQHIVMQERAYTALRRCRETTIEALDEIKQIEFDIHAADVKDVKNSTITLWDALRRRPMRRALALGCALMLLNQLTGINTVMYYSATIYSMAGFGKTAAIWLSGFSTFAQFFGVLLSSVLVEKVGRRLLMLLSLGLVTISLFFLGGTFFLESLSSMQTSLQLNSGTCGSNYSIFYGQMQTSTCYQCVGIFGCGYCAQSSGCVQVSSNGLSDQCPLESDIYLDHCPTKYGHLAVISMMCYLLFFGIGMSGLPWTLTAEIYPLEIRSISTSVSTGINWASNLLVSSTFLTLCSAQVLEKYGAFWLYASIGAVGWVWLFFNLPETKGMKLEEIGHIFDDLPKIIPKTCLENASRQSFFEEDNLITETNLHPF